MAGNSVRLQRQLTVRITALFLATIFFLMTAALSTRARTYGDETSSISPPTGVEEISSL